jgi:uncharacterized membrane protein YphA (DoxX/SURF4 family)
LCLFFHLFKRLRRLAQRIRVAGEVFLQIPRAGLDVVADLPRRAGKLAVVARQRRRERGDILARPVHGLGGGTYAWFAKMVVFGELFVGIALLLGLFTGAAAFFAGFMNWNYMMVGSASTNPVLILLAILLLLAWKTAGWWGLDRWVFPLVGTPWKPGRLFAKRTG